MDPNAVPMAAARRDGRPVWDPAPGDPLVPGHLAWTRLAVGARRETWLCWSVDLWAPAVVKTVRPGWQPQHATALHREVRALTRLLHPAVPRLLHDGRDAGQPFIAVEYLDGPDLGDCLAEGGPFPAEDTAGLGVLVLGALRALHARGLVHLDVDPFNVLLVDRRPRLVDLGSSRRLGSRLHPGERVGTDGYTAPEVGDPTGLPVTPALDVYGVGATLRRILDPGAEGAAGVAAVVDRLTDPDPARRPDVATAIAELAVHAGAEETRPWPSWADPSLPAGALVGG
ncbi:protein kinase [Geodermatophilus sp. SYSU D00697]